MLEKHRILEFRLIILQMYSLLMIAKSQPTRARMKYNNSPKIQGQKYWPITSVTDA